MGCTSLLKNMTLTSVSFFVFIFVLLVLYYVLPLKHRWTVLLLGSVTFYGIICWKYAPFILATILTTYAGAIGVERIGIQGNRILQANKKIWSKEKRKAYKKQTDFYRRLAMFAVLILNFGILAVLKYYNWIFGSVGKLIHVEFPMVTLLLPLGISFYTFQSMGYLLDVYWEKAKAEKNLFRFALFVSFFPQIIQGPIAIYDDLARQLYEVHKLKYENIKFGFQLALWGLFLKMVLADRAVVALNALLAQKYELLPFWSIFAIALYAFQLYADFSGGINISRGVAQMFGIQLAENFRRPFFSKSVSEFWRRWHISLGHWLRTYLFYPLAVSKPFLRLGKWFYKRFPGSLGTHLSRVFPGCVATLITFFVVGIWHGPAWKYAGFGLWNGAVIFIAMLTEPLTKSILEKLKVRSGTFSYRLFQMLRTFTLILVGFAFDIGNGFKDTIRMLNRCFRDPLPPVNLKDTLLSLGLTQVDWNILILGYGLLFVVSLYQERSGNSLRNTLDMQSIWFQWLVTLGAIVAVFLFGMYGPGVTASEFVYMQF